MPKGEKKKKKKGISPSWIVGFWMKTPFYLFMHTGFSYTKGKGYKCILTLCLFGEKLTKQQQQQTNKQANKK